MICRWIENDDGSQDVAEDKNTPCGTLAHVQARLTIDEKDKYKDKDRDKDKKHPFWNASTC